jgi:copper chaperone
MSEYTVNIPNMSCQHCVNRIKKALKELKIKNFKISLETHHVTFETKRPEDVVEKLDDMGYQTVGLIKK